MYVRTNKGQIFDCIESEQMGKPIYYPRNSKTNGYIDYNEVYKKSDNIIDICEVGDYVNGFPVIHIVDNKVVCGILLNYEEKDIKSIVTKEMYSSVEYRVENN